MFDYDTIDIEEFKIESDNNFNDIEYENKSDQNNVNKVNDQIVDNMDESDNTINNMKCEDKSDQNNVNQVNDILDNNIDEDVVDNIGENVNEVEGNVVNQENNDFQGLENLSVAEALAFFSS